MLDLLNVLAGGLRHFVVFSFQIRHLVEGLEELKNVLLSENARIGQMKVVFFDTVVTTCCLAVQAVLGYAKFVYLFTMLTLIHFYSIYYQYKAERSILIIL